jgi:hypothetical protein
MQFWVSHRDKNRFPHLVLVVDGKSVAELNPSKIGFGKNGFGSRYFLLKKISA